MAALNALSFSLSNMDLSAGGCRIGWIAAVCRPET
jgi:hypothetical protein